jgi:hypothetical protein
MSEQQSQRRERLRVLIDDHRCWPWAHQHGPKDRDYDDTDAELAAQFLGVAIDDDGNETPVGGGPGPVPALRMRHGRRDVLDASTSPTPCTANTAPAEPGGFVLERIIDLDTGADVPFHVVGLSDEAFAVLCGLVQPSWMAAETPEEEALAVNQGGIYADCWDELRAKFDDRAHGRRPRRSCPLRARRGPAGLADLRGRYADRARMACGWSASPARPTTTSRSSTAARGRCQSTSTRTRVRDQRQRDGPARHARHRPIT